MNHDIDRHGLAAEPTNSRGDLAASLKKALVSPAAWLLLLMVYVLYSRVWGLADKVMHHDESLFAYYGYWLYKGNGYDYQPILHGPILQFLSAFFFLLFGDDQWTMRLPSLIGGLLMFPVAWCWRRYIGGLAGAIAVTGLIAFSPSIAYYTRFLRNDVPYLTATMWCAYCLLRALQTARPRYVWGALMAATLMFCMMESSIFFFAACIGYLVTMVAVDLVIWRKPEAGTESESFSLDTLSPGETAFFSRLKDRLLLVVIACLLIFPGVASFGILCFAISIIASWITGRQVEVNSIVVLASASGLNIYVLRWITRRLKDQRWGFDYTKNPAPFIIPAILNILIIAGAITIALGWLFHRVLYPTIHIYKPVQAMLRPIGADISPTTANWLIAAVAFLLIYAISLLSYVNYHRPGGRYGLLHRFARVTWKNRWHVIGAFALAVIIYTTAFTTFFTFRSTASFDHQLRDFKGPIKALTPVQIYQNTWDYWWDQHKQHRIKGPFHYYLPILLLYELPILLLVGLTWVRALKNTVRPWMHGFILVAMHLLLALGLWILNASGHPIDWDMMDKKFHLTHPTHLFLILLYVQLLVYIAPLLYRQGRRAESFITYWGVTSLFAYSYAGEKVPWLTVHTVGPFALLAAAELVRLWKRFSPQNTLSPSLSVEPISRPGRPAQIAFLAALVFAVLYQAHNNHLLLHVHPWSPAERLVYNHTSPDIQKTMDVIEEIGAKTNVGHQLPVLVEGEMGWPLHWYMRDFSNMIAPVGESAENTSRPVVLVDWMMAGVPNLRQNYTIQRMKVREWWEPEMLNLSAMCDIYLVFTPTESRNTGPMADKYQAALGEWRKLWHYLAYREIWIDEKNPSWSNGANEFALCIRKDIESRLMTYDWLAVTPKRTDVPVFVPY